MYEIKNASLLRRFAALFIDFILVLCVYILFDKFVTYPLANQVWKVDELDQTFEKYQIEYGFLYYDKDGNKIIVEDIPQEKINQFWEDERVLEVNVQRTIYSLFQISANLLFSMIIVFYTIAIFFQNGQTFGKKLLYLGVTNLNGVKIRSWQLLSRVLIGLFAVETMISILLLNVLPFITLVVSFVLLITTKNHRALHDYISGTRVVNLQKTYVFHSEEERIRLLKNSTKTE